MEEEKIDEQSIYHNLYVPSDKMHCDICEKDISKHTKILCPKCKLDLCVTCYADQAEINDHKADHPYHIINKLKFPLYCNDWTAEEELLLFEGLEKFGFGNWQEISEHIGTGKPKEEIEDHYEQVYLKDGQPDFLPTENLISSRDPNTMELTVNLRKSRSNSEENIRIQRLNKKKSQK